MRLAVSSGLVLLGLFASRPAIANPAEFTADGEVRAILTLVVNELPMGESTVILRGDDVLVPRADVERIAPRLPKDPHPFDPMISLLTIGPGVMFRVDEAALALRLSIDPQFLRDSVITLRDGTPPGIHYAKNASAFINLAPSLLSFHSFAGFAEAGVSVRDRLLFTSVEVTPAYGAVRGLSNITFDSRADMRRTIVGDAFVTSGPLGATGYVGGVTIAREFSLNPYFATTPTFGLTGAVETPSTLDVYVNGTLVRRETIAPGTFTLQNVPVPTGAGTTTYVMHDAFGRMQSVVSPYYLSPGVLRAGLSDYALSVGCLRDHLDTDSFGYHEIGALARVRYGVTNNVTLSARAEANPTIASGGGALTALLPFGEFTIAGAASGTTDDGGEAGFAGAASYTYVGRHVSAGVISHVMTPRYATLTLQSTGDRALVDANAFVSVPLGRTVSIGAQASMSEMRDTGETRQMTLSSSSQLGHGIGLLVTSSFIQSSIGPSSEEIFANLTFVFPHNVATSVGERLSNGQLDTVASVSKPLPAGTGFGFHADGSFGSNPSGDIDFTAQGEHGRIEASAMATPTGVQTNLTAAAALVAVEGEGVFLTRPVQDGMAVVEVPGAKGVRVYLDNQEIGRTNDDGKLLIPNLLPYYGNRIRVADQDMSLDTSIAETEQIFAPPYRGAAVIRFHAKKTLFLRGKLTITKKGESIIPAYGELTVDVGPGKNLVTPIGKNGEIEIEGLAEGKHGAHVEYADGTCDLMIHAPSTTTGIVDIGNVLCVAE